MGIHIKTVPKSEHWQMNDTVPQDIEACDKILIQHPIHTFQ